MNRLAALALLLALPLSGEEQSLSELDRQLLLEKLQSIREGSDKTLKGRYAVARTAFKQARESSAAAHTLFLNCIEKVRFKEQAKKASEFREWRNRHKDRADTPSFRLALRHQLHWLSLSLEVFEGKDLPSLSSQCITMIEAILRDAEELKDQQALLRQPVLETIFAKAYDIDHVEIAELPKSPLDIEEIYDKIILPPLRNPQTIPTLRQSWLKRIEHEGLLIKEWTSEGSADKDRKPAFEKWLIEGRKNLVWAMEVDLFDNGDQRASALRMLEHLQENLTHKSAPKWIKEFTRLIEGKPAQEEEEEDKEAAEKNE